MTERTSDGRTVTTAIGNYGHTAALKDGSVKPDGYTLEFVEVTPIIAAFRRMVRALEFDVCEMAITTYLAAKEYRKPFTAIPVFPVRAFHHSAVAYNTKAGVTSPKDLEGKKVGVRAYTVTTGVWARGILASEYGVDLDKVQWVIFDEEHVQEFAMPANVQTAGAGANMGAMLASGELAAGIGAGPVDSPDVKPLLADAPQLQNEWFKKTGIYPINHLIVVKDTLLQADPRLASKLYAAFDQAKQQFLQRLDSGAELKGEDEALAKRRSLVGADPIPYGIEPNRKALEAIVQFAVDQHILSKPIAPEEMFAGVN
jgi:4,5-dihydroxyphthalate decarboxylase